MDVRKDQATASHTNITIDVKQPSASIKRLPRSALIKMDKKTLEEKLVSVLQGNANQQNEVGWMYENGLGMESLCQNSLSTITEQLLNKATLLRRLI